MRKSIKVDVPDPVTLLQEPRRLDTFLITYTDTEPARAQRISDRLAAVFVDENSKARTEHAENTSAFIAEQLRTSQERLSMLEANLRSALGQTWYQLVATFGVTALGAGALVVRSLRKRGGAIPGTVSRDARLVLLVTAPLILVSIIFMSHRTRTDHRIYGRYNDAVLWPVLIVGIAWLVNLRRTPYRRSAAATLVGVALAIVATSVGIHYVAGEALADRVGVRPMVAGLAPIIGSASSIDIGHVATVSLVLMALCLTRAGQAARRAWSWPWRWGAAGFAAPGAWQWPRWAWKFSR